MNSIIDGKQLTMSNPPTTIKAETLVSDLVFQFSRFEPTGNVGHLETMQRMINNACPATFMFLEFHQELELADAEKVAAEQKVERRCISQAHKVFDTNCSQASYPDRMSTLDADTFKAVHDIMVQEDLGQDLSLSALAFFVKLCHEYIKAANWNGDVILDRVKLALAAARIHNEFKTALATERVRMISWEFSNASGIVCRRLA